MGIPFSIEDFLDVFKAYNLAIQPFQLLAYLLGITSIILLFFKNNIVNKIIAGIISVFWIWIGVFYHILFFSSINKAAYLFGFLFIVQGLLFTYQGVIKDKLYFSLTNRVSSITGFIIISFSMLIYPLLNILSGHIYPQMPVFGVTPCPTVIYTLGFILLLKNKIPIYLFIIPFLWSLIGFSAAVNLRIIEDFSLLLAGIVTGIIILTINKRQPAIF